MAESVSLGGSEAGSNMPDEANFQVLKVYLKDISFESPSAPDIFTREWQPVVDVQLFSDALRFSPSKFEVTVTGTITAKVDGDEATAFLAEIQVAGIFVITGLTETEITPILGSYCPSILFPYLREMVSDLSVRGGFPQIVLAPVNFDALYASRQAEGSAPALEVPTG